MLSKTGDLIVIASVVIDSVPENWTIFHEDDSTDTENYLDNHSEYRYG